MKKIIALIILTISMIETNAQGNFFLEQKVCDSSKVIYTDLTQRPDGSFFVCGFYIDSSLFYKPFIVKLDANYNEVMRKVYNANIRRRDEFWKIKQMPNGNLLVLGNLESKDGAFAGIDTNTIICARRILVAEIDTLGNFVKTKTYSYCGQTIPTDLAMDNYSNIYIAGHTISQMLDFSANPEGGLETNSFLIRLDTAFNTKWLKIFDVPGSQDLEPHISINNSSDVLFVTNSFDSGGYFNASLPTPTGQLYLSCIDSNANLQWQKCYGGILNGSGTGKYEAPWSMIHDTLKNQSYIIGFCTSKDGDMYDSLDHNPVTYSESSFAIKIDSIGNKIWSHRYGPFSASNPASGIKKPYAAAFNALFNAGHLYILSEVMYSDTNWTGIAVNDDQQIDQWLIKIDENGLIKNKLRIGGHNDEVIPFINVNQKNKNIIVGMRTGSINCQPGTIGSYVVYECGVWPSNIIEYPSTQKDIKLVPNPANTVCNIMFDKPSNTEYILTLSDMNGKRIRKESIKKNTQTYRLNIEDLNKGIYLIQLKSNKEKIILKLDKL